MKVSEERGGNAVWPTEKCVYPESKTYQCWVYLTPEKSGGYSVFASLLPGVASQGETKEEALSNFAEAFRGVAEEYAASGRAIPWTKVAVPKPDNAKQRWILINA